MKRFYIYILLATHLLVASCSDWLQVTSDTEIDSDGMFETEQGFKDALLGVYMGMGGESLYAREMTWHFVDMIGQVYDPMSAALTSEAGIQQLSYRHLKVEPYIDEIWLAGYQVIANINNMLRYIESNRAILHPVHQNLMKGELLGLRAYLHFDLMRLYGYGDWSARTDLDTRMTIPYVLTYGKEITPQRSYAETFKLLMNDLNEAEKYLEEDPIRKVKPDEYYANVNSDGFYNDRTKRMNYFSVKALQARAYMWEGSEASKNKALEAAEYVINQVQKTEVKWIESSVINQEERNCDLTFSSEHIFSLQVSLLATYLESYFDASSETNYAALYLSKSRVEEVYEILPGIGLSDYRYRKLFHIYGNTKYSPIKLTQPKDYNTLYAKRVPMLRLSEMYYIAAECYCTVGTIRPDLAMARLNTVREHRGIVGELSNLNAEQIKKEIEKEYYKEFIAEGQIFFYYKRLGSTNLPGLTVPATDKEYMLPYPLSEIEEGLRVQ